MKENCENYKCFNGCCTILIGEYSKHNNVFINPINRKAGALIYDPKTDSILLVQSRGQYWGIPKGTLEDNETNKECAIREVLEETGLTITEKDFKQITRVKNRAIYFYVEKERGDISVQHSECNDANGICWVKLSCLQKLVDNGNICINYHSRLVIARFLGILFSKSNFIKI